MDKKKEEGVMDLTPLMDVVRTLRSPGGCPWDQAQDAPGTCGRSL